MSWLLKLADWRKNRPSSKHSGIPKAKQTDQSQPFMFSQNIHHVHQTAQIHLFRTPVFPCPVCFQDCDLFIPSQPLTSYTPYLPTQSRGPTSRLPPGVAIRWVCKSQPIASLDASRTTNNEHLGVRYFASISRSSCACNILHIDIRTMEGSLVQFWDRSVVGMSWRIREKTRWVYI